MNSSAALTRNWKSTNSIYFSFLKNNGKYLTLQILFSILKVEDGVRFKEHLKIMEPPVFSTRTSQDCAATDLHGSITLPELFTTSEVMALRLYSPGVPSSRNRADLSRLLPVPAVRPRKLVFSAQKFAVSSTTLPIFCSPCCNTAPVGASGVQKTVIASTLKSAKLLRSPLEKFFPSFPAPSA